MKRNNPYHPRRPLIEELEPRLLFSADFAPALADALAPQAEIRVIGSDGEFANTTDSQQQAQHARFEVVFIDLRVQGYQQILADIQKQNTEGRSIEVVLLDAERDGVAQIGDFLSQHHNIDAVHIISHGIDGSVQLGATSLNLDSLVKNAHQIISWGNALSSDADILLYGCDVAQLADGKELIDALARLTGADVAASTDLTGSVALGGDWNLEYQVGQIQTAVVLDDAGQMQWQGVLVNTAPTLGNGTLAAVVEDTASPAGQTVSTIFTGQFSDPDTSSSMSGVAVVGNTANAGTQGTWQYSTNGGINWFAIGTVADGTTALAVSTSTLVRFVAEANYNGTPPALLVRGLDNTYSGGFSTTAGSETRVNVNTTTNGGSTAIAAATSSLSTSITAVNDAPVAVNDSYTVAEDGALTVNWFDTAWTARRTLTFNNSAQSETLVDFQVLVVLNSGNIDYAKTQNNGADLRFFAADGTPLAYDIEEWNETGNSYVWVKVPQITAGSVTDAITMYYGNAAAPAGANPEAVWGGTYRVVQHMDSTLLDATANNNDGVNSSATTTPGKVGEAQLFNGMDSDINLGSAASIDNVFATGGTVTAWINPTAWGENGYGRIFDKSDATLPTSGWALELSQTTSSLLFQQGFSGGIGSWWSASGTISLGTWQQVTVTYDSSSTGNVPVFYINGVQVGTSVNATPVGAAVSDAALNLHVGNFSLATSRTFAGAIDVENISGAVRSADWIHAQYLSSTNAFVSFGGEVTAPTTGGVVGNDSDVDGNPLTVTLVSGPGSASAFSLKKDGTFSYTPNGNFYGTDSFTYRVNDGTVDSSVATATITVNPVADTPSVIGASTNEGTQTSSGLVITPNAADGAEVGYFQITVISNGTLYQNNGTTAINNGDFITAAQGSAGLKFTPAPNFNGSASFTVQASTSNGVGGLGGSTVNAAISVNPVNDAPVASGSATLAAINEDTAAPMGATVSSLFGANFSDSTDQVTGGSSANTFAGIVISSYTVDASKGNWQYSTDTGSTWTTLGNASTTTAITLDAAASTLLRFVPAANYNGAATALAANLIESGLAITNGATLNLTGATGTTTHISSATVALGETVTAVNDAPSASNLSAAETYTEDTPLNLTDIVISDADSANVSATLTLSNTAAGSLNTGTSGAVTSTYDAGTGVWTASGAIADVNTLLAGLTFTPTAGFNSNFSIATSVSDGVAAPVTGNKAMTGSAVNNAPVAADDLRAIDFDGIDDFVSIAGSASLQMSSSMTMEAWINPDSPTNTTRIIVNKEGEYEMALLADGSLNFAFAEGTAWSWHSTGIIINRNAWTHVAITYDAGVVSCYVNGTSVHTEILSTTTIGDVYAGMNELRIGGRTNNPVNQYFNGQIAEVRVWNVARSQAEIAGAMNATLTGAEAGLAGYWALDDNTGLTAADRSANANHGTLVNGAAWAGYRVDEDSVLSVAAPGVLANDFDADGNSLSAILVAGPAHGSLTLNANGSFTYTPHANYHGSDSFTYKVNDGVQDSNVATVSLRIDAVNDAPVTNPVTLAAIAEDSGARLITQAQLLSGASDTDGDSLTATGLAITSGSGSLIDNGNGTWTYTPGANDDTSVNFSYSVTDGSAPVAATASLDFTPVNDAPVVDSASLTVSEGQTVTLAPANFGITDPDDASLTYAVSAVTGGIFQLSGNPGVAITSFASAQLSAGSVQFVDDGNEVAPSFSVKVNDGSVDSNVLAASISYTPVNDAPVVTTPIADQAATEDSAFSYTFAANTFNDADAGDTLTYTAAGAPSWLTFNAATRAFSGTPTNSDVGTGTITVRATDGAGTWVEDQFNITVVNVDDAAVITGDISYTGFEGNAVAGDLNTTDIDGLADGTLFSVSGAASFGTAAIDAATGAWSFTPTDANWFGSDSFTVTVTDDLGGTTTQLVSITLANVDDAAVIGGAISYTGNEGDTVGGTMTTTDIDGLTDGTYFSVTTPAASGTAAIDAASGAWTFTPTDTNWFGSDSFTVTVTDDLGGTTTQLVNIILAPVNDAPTTTPMTLTSIAEDSGPRLITQAELLANAADMDGPSLTATGLVIATGTGTLVDNGDGTWSYTPTANDDTAVIFSYTVTDGSLTAAGTANLDITSVNDAPTTTPVTFTAIAEDSGARVITQAELLVNATDVDNPSLTATNLAISSGTGTLVDNGDGTWSYTPAANDDTSVSFSYTVTDGSLSAADTANLDITSVNDAPTGSVTITGTPTQGQTLTAANTLADADGQGTVTYTWKADGTTVGTGNSYTLSEVEVGKVITVTASYTDMRGANESVTSSGVGLVSSVDVAVSVLIDPLPIVPVPELGPVTPPVDEAPAPEAPEETIAEPVQATDPETGILQLGEFGPAGDDRGAGIVETALNAGLRTIAPLFADNALNHREVWTNPETQGGLLLRLLDIIQVEYTMGNSDFNSITPAVHVDIAQDEDFLVDVVTQGTQITAVSLSVGAVWWALRAGGLFTSLLTSLPAWRSFDLLPVLNRDDDEDDAYWGFDDAADEEDPDAAKRPQALEPIV